MPATDPLRDRTYDPPSLSCPFGHGFDPRTIVGYAILPAAPPAARVLSHGVPDCRCGRCTTVRDAYAALLLLARSCERDAAPPARRTVPATPVRGSGGRCTDCGGPTANRSGICAFCAEDRDDA